METRNSRCRRAGTHDRRQRPPTAGCQTIRSRPVSGLARVMTSSPSHAQGAQWRVDGVARLPLRGQRRTCTDFPFHLTHGGVRHLNRRGYEHPHPIKSSRDRLTRKYRQADRKVDNAQRVHLRPATRLLETGGKRFAVFHPTAGERFASAAILVRHQHTAQTGRDVGWTTRSLSTINGQFTHADRWKTLCGSPPYR